MAEFNWDEVVNDAAEASKPIPPGPYTLSVEDAKWGRSKSGNPMMSIRYAIVSGPQQGKAVWHYMTLSENDFAKQRFVSEVKAHGVSRIDFDGSPEEVAAPFFNKHVKADIVEDGEYNGQPRVRATNIRPVDGAAPPPKKKEEPPAAAAEEEAAATDDDAPPPKPA